MSTVDSAAICGPNGKDRWAPCFQISGGATEPVAQFGLLPFGSFGLEVGKPLPVLVIGMSLATMLVFGLYSRCYVVHLGGSSSSEAVFAVVHFSFESSSDFQLLLSILSGDQDLEMVGTRLFCVDHESSIEETGLSINQCIS